MLILFFLSYIFLELCTGGDLFSYIVSHSDSRLCQAETKYIMYQLLKGLKYLHDRLISHRGKPLDLFGSIHVLTTAQILRQVPPSLLQIPKSTQTD